MRISDNTIRVLLVDDEAIVRYGLKMIADASSTVEIVGEAEDGRAAIALAKTLQPDVVLMDVSMPVMDGVTATEEICQSLPQTKVLILTTHDDDQYLAQALENGAAGYLLKNTPPEDFIHIIQSIHKGYMQFSPGIGQKLCQQLKSTTPTKKTTPCKDITPREQEVLRFIAEGASNREIAQALKISEKTVKNHVSNILNRVGLRDRTQLAIWANNVAFESTQAVTTQAVTT